MQEGNVRQLLFAYLYALNKGKQLVLGFMEMGEAVDQPVQRTLLLPMLAGDVTDTILRCTKTEHCCINVLLMTTILKLLKEWSVDSSVGRPS